MPTPEDLGLGSDPLAGIERRLRCRYVDAGTIAGALID